MPLPKINKEERPIILIAFFSTFVCFLNQTTVNPALPTIIDDFGINASTSQWLLSGYLLVMAVMVPINAFLVERFSVKQLIAFSMGLYTIGCFVTALGLNFYVTLIGRLLQGCGHGILNPTVMAVLLYIFPANKRGTIFGFYGLLIGFAPILGPTFSGIIVDTFTWNTVYYTIGVCSVLCFISVFVFMPRLRLTDKRTVKLDMISLVTSTLGFGFLLFGCSEIGSFGFDSFGVSSLILGALIVVYFFWRQTQLAIPLLDLRVFKFRNFSVSIIILSITQLAFMGAIVLFPFLIQDVMHYSPTVSGLVMIAPSIVMGVMMPITGKLFDKYGFRWLAPLGMLVLTAAGLCLSIITEGSPLILLIIFLCIRNFGASFVMMNSNTWGINSLSKDMISNGNAVSTTFRQISMSFGAAISTCVYTYVANSFPGGIEDPACGVIGINASFFCQACMCAFAVVVCLIFVRNAKTFHKSSTKSSTD